MQQTEPRISNPKIAIAALEYELQSAKDTNRSKVTLDLTLANDILSYYQQAQLAAQAVAELYVFNPCEHEHIC